MDQGRAREFAAQWVREWNAHDLEAMLAHFSDDVIFTSPVAAKLLADCDGVLRGKAALRAYWEEGLKYIPDLEFEVVAVYSGVDTIVINYRNQSGGLVNEVLVFEDELIVSGHGTYLATEPASEKRIWNDALS